MSNFPQHQSTSVWLVPLAALFCLEVQAQVPTSPVLANGSAVISQTATGMRVSNTPGTILNWDSFSIGTGRTVVFDQLGAGSAILNRVTGNLPSDIQGALSSNGRVFLLNPNGILFGAGARVDVQGLVASTLSLSDADFLAGNYRFTCDNPVACSFGAADALNPMRQRIVLEGGANISTRTAGPGGQVWLIARDRVETRAGSHIDAPLGQVIAAAARAMTIGSPSLGAITFTLDEVTGTRIDLAGDIDVERGAAGFFADHVRLAGAVRVPSLSDGAGQIQVKAGSELLVDAGARLDVSGVAGADAGLIRLDAAQRITVAAAAELAADGGEPVVASEADPGSLGGQGGLIDLRADRIDLPWLPASGIAQLHAYARGAADGDFSRFGEVRLTELGQFDYQIQQGPTYGSSQVFTRNINVSRTQLSDINSGSGTRSVVESIVQSGDGRMLVVLSEGISNSTISEVGPLIGASRTVTQTSTNTKAVEVLDRDGRVLGRTLISTELSIVQPTGLLRGGWVLVVRTGPAFETTAVQVRGTDGSLLNQLDGGSGNPPLVRPLLSGGFALTTSGPGGNIERFFDAAGRPDNTVQAARPTALIGGGNSSAQNFDPRRISALETDPNGDNASLVRRDLATGSVIGQSALLPLPDRTNLPGQFSGANVEPLGVLNQHILIEQHPTTGISTQNESQLNFAIGVLPGIDGQFTNIDQSTRNRTSFTSTTSGTGFPRTSSNSNFDLRQFDEMRITGSSLAVIKRNTRTDEFASNGTTTGTSGDFNLGNSTLQSSTRSVDSLLLLTREAVNSAVPAATVTVTTRVAAGAPGAPGIPNGTRVVPDLEIPALPTPPATPPTSPVNTDSGSASGSASGSVSGQPLTIRPPQSFVAPLPPITTTPTQRQKGVSFPNLVEDRKVLTLGEETALARDIVESELGAGAAAEFDAGDLGKRKKLVNEVAFKVIVGEDFFDGLRDRSAELRGAFFSSYATAQDSGLLDDPALEAGLRRQLSELRQSATPEDGSGPARPRTGLDLTLSLLDAELKQASTPNEQARVRRKLSRELVLAAREGAGQTVDGAEPLDVPDGRGGIARIDEDGNVLR